MTIKCLCCVYGANNSLSSYRKLCHNHSPEYLWDTTLPFAILFILYILLVCFCQRLQFFTFIFSRRNPRILSPVSGILFPRQVSCNTSYTILMSFLYNKTYIYNQILFQYIIIHILKFAQHLYNPLEEYLYKHQQPLQWMV